ncbi:GIDE domain-containing protein [Nannocystis bainbridge]|uniref:RING-type E3 ubiquitin transferase n=1 Tax=Nannocystis bainbridge TaxID=2995303 RepID=A0ABT5E4G3_9BACT|nr:GIDE domain-containing protein [Nannocystis bainbridge]MDC0720630.1 GIDE domain-containing protein [Nannocystis bainbridge]
MLEPLILVTATIVAVLLVARSLAGDRQIRRALRRRRVTAIATVRDGEHVRLRGRVVLPPGALAAPLTGRACAYYVAIVDQQSANNDWRQLAHEERAVAFDLDDGTGRARVDMARSKALVLRDHRTRRGPESDPTAAELAFLDRQKLATTDFRGRKAATRFYEGALPADAQITALGVARVELRDGERHVVLTAPSDAPLYLSDEPPVVQAP